MTVVKHATKLMTKIPALAGLAGMINSAIQDTYGKIKS